VVEEKRQLIEYQLKEELLRVAGGRKAAARRRKFDDNGEWEPRRRPTCRHLAAAGGTTSIRRRWSARVIAGRLARLGMAAKLGSQFGERLAFWTSSKTARKARVTPYRQPYFCSGCPHNTVHRGAGREPRDRRHRLPLHGGLEWTAALATFTHMGAEGAPWIGQAPFSRRKALSSPTWGDGTYYHSGLLAIRAAVARQGQHDLQDPPPTTTPVAMTGGQHHGRPARSRVISRQVAAEGASPVVVETDERRSIRPERMGARCHRAPPRRARCGAKGAARSPGVSG
jgi:indolepyruvate ferredoxin oxidoreductase